MLKLPDKVYDWLKWLCILGLPAMSSLYSSLAARWGLPCGEQVSGTISDIGAFLGVVIGISSAGYALERRNQITKEDEQK